MKTLHFNALITQEDDMYVSLNPDTGVASQGKTVDEALVNLREALQLFFEEQGSKASSEQLSHQTFLTTFSL